MYASSAEVAHDVTLMELGWRAQHARRQSGVQLFVNNAVPLSQRYLQLTSLTIIA